MSNNIKWDNLFTYYMVNVHGISLQQTNKVRGEYSWYHLPPQIAARHYIHRNLHVSICGGW